MKKRNIIILSIVIIVAIAAFIVMRAGSKTATFQQDYHIEDTASITKIFISDKDNHNVLLEKTGCNNTDSAWVVDGQYTASQPVVDLLLETLNTMRIRQQVNKNATANVIKRLAANSVKVEVYQQVYFINWFKGKFKLFPHEKLTNTYFVGYETQDQQGTHMYREGDKVPYIIHIPGFRGFLGPRFPTSKWAWRSHRITATDIKHLQRVELEIPANPAESFAIIRNGNNFEMELLASHSVVNGFDTARVAQLLSSFSNLNFDEFAQAVPNTNFDTSFSQAPRTILRITNTDGRTRELKTYIKYKNPDDIKAMPDPELYETFDVNRLYAIIDNTDTVLIQYYTFDNILQPASYFLGNAPTNFSR